MNGKKRILQAAVVATVAVMFLPLVLTRPAQARIHHHGTGGTNSVACGGGTVSISPSTLWPPNHKLRGEVVTYSDDSISGSTLVLTIENITDDQTEGPGRGCGPSGSSDWKPAFPEATPLAVSGNEPMVSADIGLRSERCAEEGTRTYTVTVTCQNIPPSASPTPTPTPGGPEAPTPTATPTPEMVNLTVIVPKSQGH